MRPFVRRKFLTTVLAGVTSVALGIRPSLARAASPNRPRLKKTITPADAFDPELESFMSRRGIPGGALAVSRHGRIVYSRGYGWADRAQRLPARADSLFRIASISKPITAAGILRLLETQRLTLETKVLEIIQLSPHSEKERAPDERWTRITIRQLLQHTGGWDREQSFDPMFRPRLIAEKVGTPAPASAESVIRYMLGRPLDFEPGTRYAYSNFGYCLLGRVIERLSGQSYESFVREQVLAPLGIQRMRLGATLAPGQAEGEARYYTADEALADSVFPAQPGRVPWPYGGFNLEAMDAHGGWLAPAIELVRFATMLEPKEPYSLLKPETLSTLSEPPPPPVSRQADGSVADHYYGCGWMIRPVRGPEKANYWHSGSLPGTATLLVRRWDGLCWAVLFNQRSEDKKHPDSAIDPALHRAADAVTVWD
jgi:N-acyl-D-amino-acid deacylase